MSIVEEGGPRARPAADQAGRLRSSLVAAIGRWRHSDFRTMRFWPRARHRADVRVCGRDAVCARGVRGPKPGQGQAWPQPAVPGAGRHVVLQRHRATAFVDAGPIFDRRVRRRGGWRADLPALRMVAAGRRIADPSSSPCWRCIGAGLGAGAVALADVALRYLRADAVSRHDRLDVRLARQVDDLLPAACSLGTDDGRRRRCGLPFAIP